MQTKNTKSAQIRRAMEPEGKQYGANQMMEDPILQVACSSDSFFPEGMQKICYSQKTMSNIH